MPTYEDDMMTPPDEVSDEVKEGEPEAKEKHEGLGSLTLSSVQLPEVVDWEDGGEYVLKIRVRQENKREEEDLTTADFRILSVEAIPEKKK